MTSSPSDQLKSALEKLGAREFEVVALSMDAERGLAALDVAQTKGVHHPVAYAIKLFDSDDWQPSATRRRLVTNAHVEKRCEACEGNLFVVVTDGPNLYEETYAPCARCNAHTDTSFWRPNGERFVSVPR